MRDLATRKWYFLTKHWLLGHFDNTAEAALLPDVLPPYLDTVEKTTVRNRNLKAANFILFRQKTVPQTSQQLINVLHKCTQVLQWITARTVFYSYVMGRQ